MLSTPSAINNYFYTAVQMKGLEDWKWWKWYSNHSFKLLKPLTKGKVAHWQMPKKSAGYDETLGPLGHFIHNFLSHPNQKKKSFHLTYQWKRWHLIFAYFKLPNKKKIICLDWKVYIWILSWKYILASILWESLNQNPTMRNACPLSTQEWPKTTVFHLTNIPFPLFSTFEVQNWSNHLIKVVMQWWKEFMYIWSHWYEMITCLDKHID